MEGFVCFFRLNMPIPPPLPLMVCHKKFESLCFQEDFQNHFRLLDFLEFVERKNGFWGEKILQNNLDFQISNFGEKYGI